MNDDNRSISAASLAHRAREMQAGAETAANGGAASLAAADEEFVLCITGGVVRARVFLSSSPRFKTLSARAIPSVNVP